MSMSEKKSNAGGEKPAEKVPPPGASLNFIQEIIEEHNRTGRFGGRVHTRFPPEPNGYLHVGHAKSICLNYGLAMKYDGKFKLRYDEPHPDQEELQISRSISWELPWH